MNETLINKTYIVNVNKKKKKEIQKRYLYAQIILKWSKWTFKKGHS